MLCPKMLTDLFLKWQNILKAKTKPHKCSDDDVENERHVYVTRFI